MADGIIRQKIRVLDAGASPAGFVDLYVKDNQYYFVNSAGTITPLFLGETVIQQMVADSIIGGEGIDVVYDAFAETITISRDSLTGWMQYTNSANQSTTVVSPSFTELVIDTDFDSFAGGLFTKTTNTRIRTDFDGWVRVSYKAEMRSDDNDRPTRCVVVKNGLQIPATSQRNLGKTNNNRYQSVSASCIVSCAVNDTFSLGFGNAESSGVATIFANQAVYTVEALKRL